MKGVSKTAITILKTYVPKIKVNKTVLKSNGLGFNIIHANILKIVLSIPLALVLFLKVECQ